MKSISSPRVVPSNFSAVVAPLLLGVKFSGTVGGSTLIQSPYEVVKRKLVLS